MNTKKINILLLLILGLSFTTNIALSASSVNEVQGKIDAINAEKQKKVDELAAAQRSLDQIFSEINKIDAEQKRIEAEMAQTQRDIAAKEQEIAATEALIPVYTAKANSILLILQKNSHSNYLIDYLFDSNNEPGESARKTYVSALLSQEAMKIVNDTIALKAQFEAQKVELAKKQEDLVVQQALLQAQNEYMLALKKDAQSRENDSEGELMSAENQLKAQQDAMALMQAAGCTGDQVYGVDCGVINSSTGFIRPLDKGYVSDEYGWRENPDGYAPFHTGIDIAQNACGGPIYPTAPGTVVSTFYDSAGGNMAVIVHNVNGEQISTTYAHMSSPAYVTRGQQVDVNTQIGSVGTTGASSGCHLHLGTSRDGYGGTATRFNPREVVNFPPYGVWFYTR